MVLLHVKRGDETQFYFETQTSMSVAELIPQLVHLNNQRLKLNHLMEGIWSPLTLSSMKNNPISFWMILLWLIYISYGFIYSFLLLSDLKKECKDLLQYGPYKHPSEHGFTDEQLDQIASHQTPSAPQEIQVQGMTYLLTADPTGRRTGHAPMPAVRQQMEQTLSECHLQINASSSQQGWLTEETLEECRRLVHASVSIAYPMGLPDYDPITEMMESLPSSNKNKTDPQTEDMDAVWKGHAMSKGLLDAERCSLWWASKEWLPTKRVSDYLGTNEKTRVVVKLQKASWFRKMNFDAMDWFYLLS